MMSSGGDAAIEYNMEPAAVPAPLSWWHHSQQEPYPTAPPLQHHMQPQQHMGVVDVVDQERSEALLRHHHQQQQQQQQQQAADWQASGNMLNMHITINTVEHVLRNQYPPEPPPLEYHQSTQPAVMQQNSYYPNFDYMPTNAALVDDWAAESDATPDASATAAALCAQHNGIQPTLTIKQNYDDHPHEQHQPPARPAPIASLQCPLCDKRYCRKSTLRSHLKQHDGRKPYICQHCGKAFSQTANLSAHQRIHTGEKPFKCNICSRPFSQSSSLVTHRRTHTGEKPYPCAHCSKRFADSSTLAKHVRTHTGCKPYECDVCGQRFSQSGNLHRHSKTHRQCC